MINIALDASSTSSGGRIFGSALTDFIELERATPWCNYDDLHHLFVMFFVLLLSVVKVGMLADGLMFVTL